MNRSMSNPFSHQLSIFWTISLEDGRQSNFYPSFLLDRAVQRLLQKNGCWLRIWIRTRKGAVLIQLPDPAILILQNSMIFPHFMGFFILKRRTLHCHQIIIIKIDTKSRCIWLFFLLKMWHSEPRIHIKPLWKYWTGSGSVYSKRNTVCFPKEKLRGKFLIDIENHKYIYYM